MAHAVHAVDEAVAEYWPLGQLTHGVEEFGAYCPGVHTVQLVAWAELHDPGEHAAHGIVTHGDAVPATHTVQTDAWAAEYDPAEQVPQAAFMALLLN